VRLNHYRNGHGEPLVLIHGIGSRWQIWEPVIDRLVAHRDVIALDLPGFGASAMPPPGTPPGSGSLGSLVMEFLNEIGVQRPHFAGNSLGGLIVLELARDGHARSATALSPAGFASWPDMWAARGLLWVAVRASRRLAPRAESLLSTRTARRLALSTFVARPAEMSAAQAAGDVRGLADAPWFDETLPAIRTEEFSGGDAISAPVTIAWGSKDRLLFPRQMKRAAREIPSARLVALEGCGHVPTYDNPELVARVLLEGSEPVL
jgi:pimeloyl-ACP methyl ester carboxylesterase